MAFKHNTNITADAGTGYTILVGWNYETTGGTWGITQDSGSLMGASFTNSAAAANGDYFTTKCYLAAGTYTLDAFGYKANSYGITDFQIDGVEVASFDWYFNGALTKNVQKTQTSITVSTGGLKTIKCLVDGKNGASGGYTVHILCFIFKRTA